MRKTTVKLCKESSPRQQHVNGPWYWLMDYLGLNTGVKLLCFAEVAFPREQTRDLFKMSSERLHLCQSSLPVMMHWSWPLVVQLQWIYLPWCIKSRRNSDSKSMHFILFITEDTSQALNEPAPQHKPPKLPKWKPWPWTQEMHLIDRLKGWVRAIMLNIWYNIWKCTAIALFVWVSCAIHGCQPFNQSNLSRIFWH